MMYVLNTTSDLIDDDLFRDLELFLVRQVEQNPNVPACDNMLWKDNAGLLDNIKHKKRWTKGTGQISILKKDSAIIGISCVELSDIKELSIGGIRFWIDTNHRSKNVETTYLLADNLQWSVNSKMSGMLLTFNDYNKWIYDSIKRMTHGKAAGFSKIWSSWWKDCIVLDKQMLIRYTKQWCVIKPIDLNLCLSLKRKLDE